MLVVCRSDRKRRYKSRAPTLRHRRESQGKTSQSHLRKGIGLGRSGSSYRRRRFRMFSNRKKRSGSKDRRKRVRSGRNDVFVVRPLDSNGSTARRRADRPSNQSRRTTSDRRSRSRPSPSRRYRGKNSTSRQQRIRRLSS